jgi:Tetracyclin repressor-like, C-terminal domain
MPPSSGGVGLECWRSWVRAGVGRPAAGHARRVRRTPTRLRPSTLGAIGLAYRAWAAARPHRYRLAVQTRLGSGERGTRARDPAAQRAMAVILDAIEDLPKARQPKPEPTADLRAHLDAWAQHVGGQPQPPAALLRDVIFWSRLHGLTSLELDGHLASIQLDAELLYRAELAELGGQL